MRFEFTTENITEVMNKSYFMIINKEEDYSFYKDACDVKKIIDTNEVHFTDQLITLYAMHAAFYDFTGDSILSMPYRVGPMVYFGKMINVLRDVMFNKKEHSIIYDFLTIDYENSIPDKVEQIGNIIKIAFKSEDVDNQVWLSAIINQVIVNTQGKYNPYQVTVELFIAMSSIIKNIRFSTDAYEIIGKIICACTAIPNPNKKTNSVGFSEE